MTDSASLVAPAVIPILPAVHSLLSVAILCGSGLLAGLWALRHPRSWNLLLRLIWSQKWSLLSLAAVVAGGLALDHLVRSRAAAPTRLAGFVAGEWPARGGPQRQGRAGAAAAPASLAVRWVGGLGHTFYASPAVVGNRIYNVGFSGDRSRLFCWDLRDGKQLWTRAVPGMRATFSSPVIQGQRLYIGEGLHYTQDARVFAIDLRPGRQGHVCWQFTTNSHVECTPVVSDRHVFVTAGDDGVYALHRDAEQVASHAELAAGEGLENRVLWHVPGSRLPDVETALCYLDGRLIVGTGREGQSLVALDAASGDERGRIALPYPVHGLPAHDGNLLFAGTGPADYVNVGLSGGQVVCVDLDTFTLRWTYSTPGTVLGAVVVVGDDVIFSDTSGRVHRLDRDGRTQATWDSHAPVLASPAVADGMIFVLNSSGVLYTLDGQELSPLGETRLGPPGLYVSSPVVSAGAVCVGTPAEGFLCLGSSVDTRPPTTATLPERGTILWTRSFDGTISTPPAITESTLLISIATDTGRQLNGLVLRSDAAPEFCWSLPLPDSSPPQVITSGEVALVIADQQLLAIDAPTGTILWKEIAAVAGEPVIDGEHLWIPVGPPEATVWQARRLTDGQQTTVSEQTAPPAPRSSVVDWQIDGGTLRRIGPGASSSPIWSDLSALGDVTQPPVTGGGRVYAVVDGRQLVGLGGAEQE